MAVLLDLAGLITFSRHSSFDGFTGLAISADAKFRKSRRLVLFLLGLW